MPREEIAFTERPKIHSHSQIFRYGLFVSRVGSNFLCLMNRIRICRVPPVTNETRGHWVCSHVGHSQLFRIWFFWRESITFEHGKIKKKCLVFWYYFRIIRFLTPNCREPHKLITYIVVVLSLSWLLLLSSCLLFQLFWAKIKLD